MAALGQKEPFPARRLSSREGSTPAGYRSSGCRVLGTNGFFGKPLAAAPLCLFLHQRPDAIPLGAWGGDPKLSDAFEE
jgi:hypothetical protein